MFSDTKFLDSSGLKDSSGGSVESSLESKLFNSRGESVKLLARSSNRTPSVEAPFSEFLDPSLLEAVEKLSRNLFYKLHILKTERLPLETKNKNKNENRRLGFIKSLHIQRIQRCSLQGSIRPKSITSKSLNDGCRGCTTKSVLTKKNQFSLYIETLKYQKSRTLTAECSYLEEADSIQKINRLCFNGAIRRCYK